MKFQNLSLKTAVILPFLAAVIAIVSLYVVLWKYDYANVSKEQGNKIATALNETTQEKLKNLINSPVLIHQVYNGYLRQHPELLTTDLIGLEDYSVSFLTAIHEKSPQISTLGFGTEAKGYLGVRTTEDPQIFNLMLKDDRTKNMLNIYEGTTMASKIVGSYEGNDPTGRPWYSPVKANQVPQWSEIYVNMDERMESTISSLMPIFDPTGVIQGVSVFDIKLEGINTFLKSDIGTGTGVIYIVDDKWQLIANSSAETAIEIIPGDTPTAKQLLAISSKNLMISSTSKYLSKQANLPKDMQQIPLLRSKLFTQISEMKEPSGLNWRVVVVIPEADLMGAIQRRQNLIILSTLIFVSLTAMAGFYLLSQLTTPILRTAAAATEFANGNWETQLVESDTTLNETKNLVQAFNSMSSSLKDSFLQLQLSEIKYKSLASELIDAQKEIDHLHQQEKENLNKLISERTEELKIVMKELIEKEKFASLGGLVSGVAHEINTPLGVAVSTASYMEVISHKNIVLLESNQMTKTDFVEYMEAIEESSRILNTNLGRAADLVKSFKAIAVNQSIEEKSHFNFKSHLKDVLLSLKHTYKHMDLSFLLDFSDDLMLYSYSGAFSQIFTNLIMNSLIHGFNDRHTGIIQITASKSENILKIHYFDNGNGMTEEILNKIFDPFFTTNRGQGGSGLGLNVVYNLLTSQLNGKITCTSQLNEGTHFYMDINLD
jgi:signal transduction histidine kinase